MYLVDPHVRIQSPKKLLVVSWSPQIYKYRTLSIGSTNCFVVVEVVLWKKSPTWKPRWSWLPSTLPHQNQLSSCLQKMLLSYQSSRSLKIPVELHWVTEKLCQKFHSSEFAEAFPQKFRVWRDTELGCAFCDLKLAKFYWTGYIEQYSIWCWCKQTLA